MLYVFSLLFLIIMEFNTTTNASFHKKIPYNPPDFIKKELPNPPSSKVILSFLKTPLHKWKPPNVDSNDDNNYGIDNLDFYIKRDDMSGSDVSGNKIRKLEFLMAECLKDGADYDSVITIGGVQSNHARATACVARQLGFEPHLILRGDYDDTKNHSLLGNLLYDRLVGASIYPVSPSVYAIHGQDKLCNALAKKLQKENKKPFVIPVGGSNPVGMYGYLEFVNEFMNQIENDDEFKMKPVDHFVFACGSGGTAAGISLGMRLYQLHYPEKHVPKVHAICVCDSPDVFYEHIHKMAELSQVNMEYTGDPAEWLSIYDGQGLGYAKSTKEELDYFTAVATTTGVLLDPVYSLKALYYTAKNLHSMNIKSDSRVVFLHTGGTYGTADKAAELLPSLSALAPKTTPYIDWAIR